MQSAMRAKYTPPIVLQVNEKDTVLQVHLLRQVHFAGDGGEDETLLSAVRQRELDLPVQTTGAQEGGVKCVCSIGGHNHLKVDQWKSRIITLVAYLKFALTGIGLLRYFHPNTFVLFNLAEQNNSIYIVSEVPVIVSDEQV